MKSLVFLITWLHYCLLTPLILGPQESWPPECSSGTKRGAKEDRWVYASEYWGNWREGKASNTGKIKPAEVFQCMIFSLVWNINTNIGKYAQEKYTDVIERRKRTTCNNFSWFCFEGPSLFLSEFVLVTCYYPECLRCFWDKASCSRCTTQQHLQKSSQWVSRVCIYLAWFFHQKEFVSERTSLCWHMYGIYTGEQDVSCIDFFDPLGLLSMFLLYLDWISITGYFCDFLDCYPAE